MNRMANPLLSTALTGHSEEQPGRFRFFPLKPSCCPCIIQTMTLSEVWQVAAAVIASFGGGGAIVFALSGYLGKVWADRALQSQRAEGERQLEKQRQEYAQLNISFTHQLDLASKQVQAELDRIGLLHKLRTESEFQKLADLWKTIARLKVAFHRLPNTAYDTEKPDGEARHQSCLNWSKQFFERWRDAFELWNEEALSIPNDIYLMAAKLLQIANEELPLSLEYPDPFDKTHPELLEGSALADFLKKRSERAGDFGKKSDDLLDEIRKYLQGIKGASKSKV
jgi:hypothetical protein